MRISPESLAPSAWRGSKSAGKEYADEAGFSYSANLAEIKDADYALTRPLRWSSRS